MLETELAERLEQAVRATLTEQILREANLEGRVADALAKIETPDAATLEQDIRQLFTQEPERAWRDLINAVVAGLKVRKDG